MRDKQYCVNSDFLNREIVKTTLIIEISMVFFQENKQT